MDKELVISLRLDRSKANQQSEAFHSAERTRIDSTKGVHAEAEQAKTRATAAGAGAQVAAVKRVTQAHAETGSALKGVQDGVGSLVGSYLGFGAVVGGVQKLGDAWREVGRRTEEAGQKALQYEKDTRELAALRGFGSAEQAVPGALSFSLKTRLDARSSDDFQRQFYGSLPAGLQKGNIDQDTADKLAEAAGVMAARQGGSAGVRGDLAGILSQFTKLPAGEAGVTKGLGQLEAVRVGLTEGRGDDTPLTAALLHVAGSMVKEKGGAVASLPEMAALVGVTSLSAGPGMADTRAEQLLRGVRGTTPEQIKALKERFGVDESDTLEQRLDKVIPQLREVGKTRDISTYLIETKLANEEQARSLAEIEPSYEVLKKRMASARAADQGDAVRAANEQFMGSPLGKSMEAQNKAVAADVVVGSRYRDASNLFSLERSAQTAGEADLSMLTYGGDVMEGLMSGALSSPAEAGRQKRIEYGALDKLRVEAARVGVKPSDVSARIGGFFSSPTAAEEAQALAETIRGRGGDPYAGYGRTPGGSAGSSPETVRLLEQIRDELRGIKRPAVPPALPGAPGVVNRGPAG